jgi:uncharacterized membrane protein YfcA
MLSFFELLLLFLAALAAGATNALAGGGSIFTFPALIALGLPPVSANVTNTVALCPGYVGGVIGQWRDLRGQGRRMLLLLPFAAAGGIAGGLLLLQTSDEAFEDLIPALVIGACILLAVQDRVRALLQKKAGLIGLGWAIPPVILAAIYGGYFGAGLSVMFLAMLGIAIADTLARLNALKQTMSLVVNVAAALLFIGSNRVVWPAATALAVGALAGGTAGGRLASIIAPATLRLVVLTAGVLIAIVFALRG